MASNVIRVSVLADAKQFESAMKNAGTAAERQGEKFAKFAKVAVAAFAVKAVAAVKDFASDSVDAFSDLNESLNALDVTFGDAADGIKKLGKGAADSLGMSNVEFNNFAVRISAFAQQIAGDGGDVVSTVDELSQRVTDFASVMNLEVADAAQKFQSGLAGESEPLRAFGIDVSAAKVEMVALAEGIWDGTGKMTEAHKVQARYRTIMQQTEKTAGDFANTIDEYANAQRRATAAMEDSKAVMGQALMPAMERYQSLVASGGDLTRRFGLMFGRMTGSIDQATQAVHLFQLEYDRLPETAGDVGEMMDTLGVSFVDLKDAMGLSGEQLEEWNDLTDAQLEQMGWSQAAIDELEKAVRDYRAELKKATDDQNQNNIELGRSKTQHEAASGAIDRVTLSYEQQNEMLHAIVDPAYALLQSTKARTEAQNALNEAIKEHGRNSPEYLEALNNFAEASMDVNDAQVRLNENGPLTEENLRRQAAALGLAGEEAENWVRQFEILASYNGKTVKIGVIYDAKTTGSIPPGVTPVKAPPTVRAGGGPVSRGNAYTVGERGTETFVPDSDGTIVPHGGGSGVVLNITVNALDARGAANAVVQALQEYERTHGPVPINVRTR